MELFDVFILLIFLLMVVIGLAAKTKRCLHCNRFIWPWQKRVELMLFTYRHDACHDEVVNELAAQHGHDVVLSEIARFGAGRK